MDWFSRSAKKKIVEAVVKEGNHVVCADNWLTDQHIAVSNVGDGKDVRRHFSSTTALENSHGLLVVNGHPLVRIDGHAEQSRISLSKMK